MIGGAGKKVGYLRVSTHEQRPDRQIDGLSALCDELHFETLSATSRRRPVYEAVIARLKRGDTLVVWDLDRAFRSVIDAVTEAENLQQNGIEFHIVNLQIDTATPAGMLVYVVMSAIAEFERRQLSQRTLEGLAAARRRGARLGRPPKLSAEQLAAAKLRLSSTPETMTSIASEYGVAPWSLTRALRRQENLHRP